MDDTVIPMKVDAAALQRLLQHAAAEVLRAVEKLQEPEAPGSKEKDG